MLRECSQVSSNVSDHFVAEAEAWEQVARARHAAALAAGSSGAPPPTHSSSSAVPQPQDRAEGRRSRSEQDAPPRTKMIPKERVVLQAPRMRPSQRGGSEPAASAAGEQLEQRTPRSSRRGGSSRRNAASRGEEEQRADAASLTPRSVPTQPAGSAAIGEPSLFAAPTRSAGGALAVEQSLIPPPPTVANGTGEEQFTAQVSIPLSPRGRHVQVAAPTTTQTKEAVENSPDRAPLTSPLSVGSWKGGGHSLHVDKEAFFKEWRKQQKQAMEELFIRQEQQLHQLLDKHGLGGPDGKKDGINRRGSLGSGANERIIENLSKPWADFDFIRSRLMRFFVWWSNLEEPPRTGCLADAVKSQRFETMCITVIMGNCAFILISLNWMAANLAEEDPAWFRPLEIAFSVFYFVEILLRLLVHRLYFFVNRDLGWNNVDFWLVVFSTWHLVTNLIELLQEQAPVKLSFLRSFRIFKLARLLRLVRVIRFFRDLRVMLDCFLNSFLALFWCMLLLVFTIGIFALIFVQLVTDWLGENFDDPAACDSLCVQELQTAFGSVEEAMLSLYMATTGGNDWAQYWTMLWRVGSGASGIFVFYTAFYYFGVFNLLTGMFVDKALKASEPDSNMLIVESRASEQVYVSELLQICEKENIGDFDGMLDQVDFKRLVEQDRMLDCLGEMGLDTMDAQVLFGMMSNATSRVPLDTFVRGCMRMKGAATSIDLQALHCELRTLREQLMEARKAELVNLSSALVDDDAKRAPAMRKTASEAVVARAAVAAAEAVPERA